MTSQILSFVSKNDCNDADKQTKNETKHVQMIQLADTMEVEVYECKINILRCIDQCRTWSIISVVKGGIASYIMEVTESVCKDIHKSGSFVLPNRKRIDNIKRNMTCVQLAGSTDKDGSCNGDHYMDHIGAWASVIVVVQVIITLKNYRASTDLQNNKIHLQSGLTCDYSLGTCIDYSKWVCLLEFPNI